MTDSRLGDLMHDLVAEVGGPPLARTAWARSVRIRRRRRALAAVASGAMLAAVAFALVGALGPEAPTWPADTISDPPISASPLPAVPGEPRIRSAPARDDVAELPALSSPLAALSSVPTTAIALADSPLSKVVAAVQRVGGPVLVLGPGNEWRSVTGAGLSSDAIAPDGRRLALVQSDGVRVLDVSTGTSRFRSVPRSATGRIDALRWLADGRQIALGGDAGSVLLSVADGQVTPLDGPAHELAVGRSGDPLVRLTRSELVTRSKDGRETRHGYGTGEDVELNAWNGTGRQAGGRVAQTAFLRRDDEQAVAVIDLADGRVTDLLTLDFGRRGAARSYGCCETLGWVREQTVLLRDGGSVLAWRPATGQLYRVAQLPGTATRGLDPGEQVRVAIAP